MSNDKRIKDGTIHYNEDHDVSIGHFNSTIELIEDLKQKGINFVEEFTNTLYEDGSFEVILKIKVNVPE